MSIQTNEAVLLPKTGLFVFHRDLRLHDNTGLRELAQLCDRVYCAFIFTPAQIGRQNHYKSSNAVEFMIECLDDLQTAMGSKLIVLHGEHTNMCDYLIQTYHIDVVATNADYSPYARKRDAEVEALCGRRGIYYLEFPDYSLFPMGSVLATGGEPFKKFTPFYDHVRGKPVSPPQSFRHLAKIVGARPSQHTITLENAFTRFVGARNPELWVHGGRKRAMAQLIKTAHTQHQYTQKRDEFSYATSYLSAYIKFGCVSIREVHTSLIRAYGASSGMIRELLWREFFVHILYAFPTVLDTSFRSLPAGVEWKTRPSALKNWMRGTTGVSMIDACMRQLNRTGYMHNRGRMLVATYLTKTLQIHWKHGERYFATKLIDYDPASNNGNWQYLSSTGVYANPWFRTMSAEIQGKKYDRDHEYRKRWLGDDFEDETNTNTNANTNTK